MLTHIHILNFAIVENLELDFSDGMTVLTGETGAGKSIIIDALGLALGERADSNFIRHGYDRAEVTVGFTLENLPFVFNWLQQQDLIDDVEPVCLVRRVITNNRRSRAYINNRQVTVQLLQTLGNYLVDIHGQHEHQSLLKRDQQLALLDDYCGHQSLVKKVADSYQQWKKLADELQHLTATARDQDARLELLNYQIQELKQLDIQPKELEELTTEHSLLANTDQLLSSCQHSLEILHEHENHAVDVLLSRILDEMTQLSQVDSQLNNVVEFIQQALIQVEEASADLSQYMQQLELDPERLQQIEQRIGAIHEMARKYRRLPEELPEHLAKLEQEYAIIGHIDERLDTLQQAAKQQHEHYLTEAKALSEQRQKIAIDFNEKVSELMARLSMAGHFSIEFQALEKPNSQGFERIEFMVSSNPGQPPQSITKIASGGELSRISLAIQVIAADTNSIPSLVFDEVDVGIGGRVAEIVGQLLRQLGARRQILCITHLPQVAAQGHYHLQVSKQVIKQQTHTQIQLLTKQQQIDEIARMLGGVKITKQTKAHAQEMINMVS